MRDMHPVREIVIWSRITWAVEEFLKRHPEHEKKAVFGWTLAAIEGRTTWDGKPPAPSPAEMKELRELAGSVPAEYDDPSSPVYDG
jgi:hypothetical protein